MSTRTDTQTPKEPITLTIGYMFAGTTTETFVAYNEDHWITSTRILFLRVEGYARGGDPQTGAYLCLLPENKVALEAWAKAHEESIAIPAV